MLIAVTLLMASMWLSSPSLQSPNIQFQYVSGLLTIFELLTIIIKYRVALPK